MTNEIGFKAWGKNREIRLCAEFERDGYGDTDLVSISVVSRKGNGARPVKAISPRLLCAAWDAYSEKTRGKRICAPFVGMGEDEN